MNHKTERITGEQEVGAPEFESRRKFIKSSVYLGAVGVSGLLGSSALGENASGKELTAEAADRTSAVGPAAGPGVRAYQAYKIRERAARQHLNESLELPAQQTNGDDRRYAHQRYYASFTKALPHNRYGEVVPSAYRALLRAQRSGRYEDFDKIPLAIIADRVLANPQGGNRFIYAGLDGHATRMRPAPSFRSAESAAEMGELYWQALTREVPFNRYEWDADIASAVTDLNKFSEPVGPKEKGLITPTTLFRGPTPGDLTGPYLSQFLWKKVPYGPSVIEQRYERPQATDFMIDEPHWLNVQRGGSPQELIEFESEFRFLSNNRGLGEYVHRDALFQAYFNAGLILLSYGSNAIDRNNPYFNGEIINQGAFTSLGGPYMIDLVTQAGNLALQGAWYQKWLEHRRLRPEVYGGRVHFVMTGQRNYEIHRDILNSAALVEVSSLNGSYFLPMAYTEGSPTHPSYPAGHATVAGACTTTLKAYFNEDFVIDDPVIANDDGTALNAYKNGPDLTVGGELNKLASNIAIGRNAAGVHYRADGVDGLLVGEQQAIALLKDCSRALSEDFEGFNLTKFDGTRVVIWDGQEITL